MRFQRRATALALAATAMAVSAQKVDFDEFGGSPVTYYPGANGQFETEGFRFSNSAGADDSLGVWGKDFIGFQADPKPAGASIFVNHGGSTTTMTRAGGGSFNFYSIDFADVYNVGASITLQLTFTLASGGADTQPVTLDAAPGLQTFVFSRTGLASVSWVTTAGDSGWNQFDNIQTASVPEPATWLAMLAGLGLLGLRRRHA